MADELDELIVTVDQKPDLKILAEILKGNVQLVENGEIRFEEKFHRLSQPKMILVYLLARKAAILKELLKEKEGISSKEIANVIGLVPDTVRGLLARELKDVVYNDDGLYTVPNRNLFKCKVKLVGK